MAKTKMIRIVLPFFSTPEELFVAGVSVKESVTEGEEEVSDTLVEGVTGCVDSMRRTGGCDVKCVRSFERIAEASYSPEKYSSALVRSFLC